MLLINFPIINWMNKPSRHSVWSIRRSNPRYGIPGRRGNL